MLFVATSILFGIGAAINWELIEQHLDSDAGLFAGTVKTTGLENVGNPAANTYSIIGGLDAADYIDDAGYYTFKIEWFGGVNGPDVELVWKQTTWLTETHGTKADIGMVAISGPSDSGIVSSCGHCEFWGLAKSQSSSTYLDGTGDDGGWWNSVGTVARHNGAIPGYNRVTYKGQKLYIALPGHYELILAQKEGKWFNAADLTSDGLVNENNPDADTYSIVGSFDAAKRAEYKTDGAFHLKLVYQDRNGNPDDILIWSQTSWITASSIAGADLSAIPAQDTKGEDSCRKFRGLGDSNSDSTTYLDSNGNSGCWWGSTGQYQSWAANAITDPGPGIPGFFPHIAKSLQLYIKYPYIACDDGLVPDGNGGCSHDCSTFDINGFLEDCSSYHATVDDIDQLQTDIGNEETARIAADQTLQTNIDNEAQTRLDDDAAIDLDIQALQTEDGRLQGVIDQEVIDRTDADGVLQGDIDQEIADRAAADTQLGTHLDAVISAEVVAREAADTHLGTHLENVISNEGTARLDADQTLQDAIDQEVSDRETADGNLQDQIDTNDFDIAANSAANGVEVTDRADGDAALRADIGDISLQTYDNDYDLQTQINAITNRLDDFQPLSQGGPNANAVGVHTDIVPEGHWSGFWAEYKDIAIFGLLVVNILMMAMVQCSGFCGKGKSEKHKYRKVAYLESDDVDVDSEAIVNLN